ncbi:hypothetical protein NLG97_g4776 [Lecanicillium saksenae]|uniref:Uncharacterized protein n=1 Tax=Lecanicillium saksenae TaxID=468837 RepID=A0ACC1QUH8_9HYPO|nr:hypothetical protein NLG97_g4776 [Lecanicillium saksenae]
MNAVRRHWFRAPTRTDTSAPCVKSVVDEADVFPVHKLDSMAEYQKFLAKVMLFNDALDANMLNASLSRLLEIGDWRKLGGRIKKDSNGRLQIHVPRQFSDDQPAVAYTHECLATMSISDHPIARQFPTHTGGKSMQSVPSHGDLRTLQVRPDFPGSLDALMAANLPPLSLHVHTFKDATIVGLAWPHLLMDGIARSALMKSWSLVMAGQEDKVPLVVGARHDVLSDLPPGSNDQDEFFEKKGLLHGTKLARFALRWGWEKLTGPAKSIRMIYLPKATYDALVGEIKDQVFQIGEECGERQFISEVDAVTAWIINQLASLEPERPLMVLSLANCRYLLKRQLSSDGAYLQNMVLINYIGLSSEEASGAVGPLALNCRRQLREQMAEPRVLSFIKWLTKRVDEKFYGVPSIPLCGDEHSTFICINSMLKAGLITNTDFAPAVLHLGDAAETRQNPAGSMVNFFYDTPNEPTQYVNIFNILGNDHSGGVWFFGHFSQQMWDRLEQTLEQLTK